MSNEAIGVVEAVGDKWESPEEKVDERVDE